MNSVVQKPTLRVSQLKYKTTRLWQFRLNRSSDSGQNNGKTHPCFRTFRRVMACVYYKSVILDIKNLYCFAVFSKSKAFHGILHQEKTFTITFCKPCKLFVNLWTFFFLFRKCPMALRTCSIYTHQELHTIDKTGFFSSIYNSEGKYMYTRQTVLVTFSLEPDVK